MNVEDCFHAGFIARAHGIKGELRVIFDVDDINAYKKKASVYLLREGKLTLFSVQYIRLLSGREALVKFKDVEDRTQAEAMAGTPVLLPLSELPELSGNKFYYHEIVGFQVEDQQHGTLGKVREVREMPGQDLILMVHEGKEVLIPITDQIVLRPDRERKVLETNLPEGLLEVYME
ncbi:MAG: 16S rRNA processing protein RimM [Bacteroidia bacterium]|nr:16S rRNA processing protein RimM [Bacteroidia bacterium]